MDLEEYDIMERKLILEEHEKRDGRSAEEINEAVKKTTLPVYLALVRSLNQDGATSTEPLSE